MADILVENGLVIDGTGARPFKGHVKVVGDRIAAVVDADTGDGVDLIRRGAQTVIDAEGCCVAPGFIDAHSHFDWVLPLPDHDFLHPLLEQGITTLVTGNCGFSPAPVTADNRDQLNSFGELLSDKPLSFNWRGMSEYLDQLSRQDLLFNTAQLLGHGAVHLAELNDMSRRPRPPEIERIADTTARELNSGVFGLSLGLMYPPGMFYAGDDLKRLAETAADHDSVLTVHMRAFSRYSTSYPNIPFLGKPHNLRALEEILDIGLKTGVKLQISHFLFVGRSTWKTLDKAVRMIESARRSGLSVMWDVYPHFCGNSYLNVFLPPWFQKDQKRNIENPKAIAKLKFELKLSAKLLGFELSDIQIMQTRFSGGEVYQGLNFQEIAAMEGLDIVDCFIELVRKSNGKALQLTYGYSGDSNNEEMMAFLLGHECCLYATDTILKSSGFPNPASYGAFPRILGKFVREKKTVSLPNAVAKMSGASARWFGLPQRGEIIAGNFADLVVFDPESINDNTTRKETALKPSGIEKVLLNGALAVDNGDYVAGTRAGEVITRE
jgi:N-acyl-D-amino-acid deacylase